MHIKPQFMGACPVVELSGDLVTPAVATLGLPVLAYGVQQVALVAKNMDQYARTWASLASPAVGLVDWVHFQ